MMIDMEGPMAQYIEMAKKGEIEEERLPTKYRNKGDEGGTLSDYIDLIGTLPNKLKRHIGTGMIGLAGIDFLLSTYANARSIGSPNMVGPITEKPIILGMDDPLKYVVNYGVAGLVQGMEFAVIYVVNQIVKKSIREKETVLSRRNLSSLAKLSPVLVAGAACYLFDFINSSRGYGRIIPNDNVRIPWALASLFAEEFLGSLGYRLRMEPEKC